MITTLISNVLILGGIALLAALALYFISKKFYVKENPLSEKIEKVLPGANCGACGKAGCQDFAKACASCNREGFADLYCSVGGDETMQKVADLLGFKAVSKTPQTAVLKCNGTCENAPIKLQFDKIISCRLANQISVGQTECPNGCLRLGDCVKVCKFSALKINEQTLIPEVDESKCTACGACVKICPRGLFEIRPKSPDGKRVYVACSNKQKGALARKNCKVACIGCGKCSKICDLIKVENNLSYIPSDVSAEKYGEELVKACPTGAIVMTNNKKEQ